MRGQLEQAVKAAEVAGAAQQCQPGHKQSCDSCHPEVTPEAAGRTACDPNAISLVNRGMVPGIGLLILSDAAQAPAQSRYRP
jgi:hypothetical protein